MLLKMKDTFNLADKVGPLEPGIHKITGVQMDHDNVILSYEVDHLHEVNADDIYQTLDNNGEE